MRFEEEWERVLNNYRDLGADYLPYALKRLSDKYPTTRLTREERKSDKDKETTNG